MLSVLVDQVLSRYALFSVLIWLEKARNFLGVCKIGEARQLINLF